ncbi:MAG: dihydropteroate synthase [Fibrobacter sp.]|jgi:dihydropteroate synthase|nr:dihydropteroate synthase [Fibrobacter sp.]
MFKEILRTSKAIPWNVGGTDISGNPVPAIMGIVNNTPDSFFDGGKHHTIDLAYEHALKLLDEGADIIDLGGESTRPGAAPVSEEEELNRIIPLVKLLVPLTSRKTFWISVDTVKSKVASEAMHAGAHIINDISALQMDSQMARTVAETGASVVLNHMRGSFGNMQNDFQTYDNVFEEVRKELQKPAEALLSLGVPKNRICLDPGIGFGKTLRNNLDLIAEAESFLEEGYPLLYGMSRKSYIGKIMGLEKSDRLIPTIVSGIFAALGGVSAVRVHDVRETKESFRFLEAFRV